MNNDFHLVLLRDLTSDVFIKYLYIINFFILHVFIILIV